MENVNNLKELENKIIDFETKIEKEIIFVNKTRRRLLLYLALALFLEGLASVVNPALIPLMLLLNSLILFLLGSTTSILPKYFNKISEIDVYEF